MKVLIVANHNTGRFSPFVVEQVESLRKAGVEIDYFGIVGKGAWGYLRNLPALQRKIKEWKPDIVHAHYGLSGLLATLQNRVPVVVTYHGSDIHGGGLILKLSQICMKRAAYNIFVSEKLRQRANYTKKNLQVLPCGVNIEEFVPMGKDEARIKLGWGMKKNYVLFAGAFDNVVKNAPLAKEATDMLNGAELMELKGYTRRQVCLAMNACDCLLMTSHNEGSPQVIKEAMACNTPVVSVRVGDVEDVVKGTIGCHIADYDAVDIANKLIAAFAFGSRTAGRQRIIELGLSNELVAKRVKRVYEEVLGEK